MFLLILESIGTSELLLIAVVALIVFGPRKLPQMAKTLGKTMSEFRNATNEFKSTWEREVAFEDDAHKSSKETTLLTDTVTVGNANAIEIKPVSAEVNLLEPKVRELSSEEASRLFQKKNELPETPQEETKSQPIPTKKDWL